MNKHKLNDFLQQKMAAHRSSLKATSFDKSNQIYVCQDEMAAPVYDFDAYILNSVGQQQLPASPDAIYIGAKQLYFIEWRIQAASATV